MKHVFIAVDDTQFGRDHYLQVYSLDFMEKIAIKVQSRQSLVQMTRQGIPITTLEEYKKTLPKKGTVVF